MAESSHERQRLFSRHFEANENRVQERTALKMLVFTKIPNRMSYKPAGKDDGIFRPLSKRLFWILWCR